MVVMFWSKGVVCADAGGMHGGDDVAGVVEQWECLGGRC